MYNNIFFVFVLLILSCSTAKNVRNDDQNLVEFRNTYKNGFLQDPRSPLTKDDLQYLDFYDGNKDWTLTCDCKKVEKAKPFELPTYSGVTRTYIVHSDLSCLYKGQTILLKLYKNITQPINPLYKNNLFLPFKDHTNGETTYGGGRYINLYETEIQNEKIIIDFNKCYNPWCAYSDGYNCPIPPKENHIEMEILAGEKKYKGTYKAR